MTSSSNNNNVSLATSILTRAITLDTDGRYTESLICYQEGIQILMEALKNITDEVQKKALRSRIEDYMGRAEKLKTHMETLKSSGKYREQIQIKDGSIGHSYSAVFSRFLDSSVTEIHVDDPYIRLPHQCDNFLRLVELFVKSCDRLQTIHLTTGSDPSRPSEQQLQQSRLNAVGNSLSIFKGKGIHLVVKFSDSLHDREVRLDNGWVIKIGRGLDYFKPVDKHTIGWSDFDLRPCRETTIDIFHRKDLVKCSF